METIIDCFKNHIRNEGYRIIENDDGSGEIVLDSDVEGRFEYEKYYKTKTELNLFLLQIRVNATDALINYMLEHMQDRLYADEENIHIIEFLERNRGLQKELIEMAFQLSLVEWELNSELFFREV